MRRFLIFAPEFSDIKRNIQPNDTSDESNIINIEKCGDSYIPLYCHIDITNRCNFRCLHCYQQGTKRHKDLDIKKIDHILKKVKEMGGFYLTISGGEPLLHPEFSNIIKNARKLGYTVTILSNGSLINHEVIKIFREYFIKLVVTLNGFSDLTTDSFTRIGGSFSQTMKAIQLLIKNKVKMSIKSNFTQKNFVKEEYENLLEFCASKKIDLTAGFTFFPTLQYDYYPCSLQLPCDEIYEALIQYYTVFKDKQIRKRSGKACLAGTYQIAFDANGDIYPCTTFPLKVGSIKDDIKTVWNDSKLFNELRAIKNEDFKSCNKCKYGNYCVNFCVAINYLCTQDIYNVPKTTCEIAEMQCRIHQHFGDRSKKQKE